MACVGADRGPDVVRRASLEVGFEAFAVGVIDVPVHDPPIGRNLDLVAPEHDTAVGAAVAVVAQEDIAIDCDQLGTG